jgi:hypothetical protein
VELLAELAAANQLGIWVFAGAVNGEGVSHFERRFPAASQSRGPTPAWPPHLDEWCMGSGNPHARWMITAIKAVHSAIFLSIAAAILDIFVAGLRGRPTRWTGLALALALGESAVFALNRFRCPLTEVVRNLTGASVRVTDIFLPRWFADRIPFIFTPPLLIGLLGLARGRWMRSRRAISGFAP